MAYTTIKKPSDYFNTKLYTGNGSTLNVTGLDFQPDFTWLKCRGIAYNHRLYDVIRTPLNSLESNSSNAESSDGDGLSAFNSDGFTVTQGGNTEYNNNGVNYVGWNWLANNTSGSSNTDGSITSTVSVNTTSGFSIVSYTGNGSAGATIGHGLGVSPSWIVTKKRSATGSWVVYHKSQGATKYGILDTTASFGTSSSLWNDTEPTSSVFSVGTDADTNGSSATFIAYCFAEKKGFSKFGSYTGNGNADGSFIYTGFKPAFINIKRTDSLGQWNMFDIARADVPNANGNDQVIYSNSADAELSSTTREIDLLSNGFKCKATGGDINASGGSYVYMCFAEEPLVGDNPCTAR